MNECIYCRVSSDDQTLEQQEAACRRLLPVQSDHVEVLAEKKSGWTTEGREAYQRLLKLVQTRQVSTVIVYKLDRLGRNAREVFNFACECAERGVTILSVHDSVDTSTPMGRAMVAMLATVAEMERSNTILRTREKFRHYKEEFDYHGHGSLPGWFSERAIQSERLIRTLASQGWTAWAIAQQIKLDHRTVKKILRAHPGSLKTKQQVHAESPGWYKTPAEQRAEHFSAKRKRKPS